MADPFVAEIRIFPFNFAPRGWAWCNGQLLPISQNTALFSLLGTVYGGDGKSTFALPNLMGSVPLHPGQGPGLSLYDLGQIGGSETVTLLISEIPAHTHAINASADPADQTQASPARVLARSDGGFAYFAGAPNTTEAAEQLGLTGGSLPHTNMMPYVTYYFNIALQGVFPARP
ncbi:MAG TPA: tail fiber protein [Pyrinomonadaceae bacterium]|nr:tail fiber protein [Pyrinomonadaceae bacterium]